MTDLVIRSLRPDEDRQLLLSLPDAGHGRTQPLPEWYEQLAGKGEFRPEWTWIAVRGDRLAARAIWWGGPDDTAPATLLGFDFDDPDDGTALLRAAPFQTEYLLQLPPGWRTHAEVRDEVERRIEAAARAGLRPFVERFRYAWTPANGLAERPGRLEFRPEPDDEVILDVLRGVMEGTLDAHERRLIAREGVDAAAREELAFFRWCPSPRDWWRLAYTPDGQVVGISVPARNHNTHVIAYVGVLPAHRGRGYAYDLLVEATQLLVAEGATSIAADTDAGNSPMAATFARAGYPVDQERMILAPDPVSSP